MSRREMSKGKCRIEESSFPEEIIEEIILRLPSKSLLRFTSVSKQWQSLISHPNFTKNHLNRLLLDQSNNHQRLLVRSYHIPSTFYSTHYQSIHSISIPVKRNFPLLAPRGIEILGSCNGLFFVRLNKKSLYLWNPSFSRDFRRLPTSNCFPGHVQILGFGYDSSIDDYKVVRIVTCTQILFPLGFLDQKVEVYNLKTNSWRRIPDIPYGNIILIYQVAGTLVKGSLYWRIIEQVDEYSSEEDDEHYSEQEAVLGFDLAIEKFRLVPLPDEQVAARWGSRLSVVSGSLATIQIYRESPLVVVWILKEDGEKNEFSWTKLMKIPNLGDACSLPCYMKSVEFLLSLDNKKSGFVEDQLIIYNEKNISCRQYLICRSSFWLEEHKYIETLVSPKGVFKDE